MGKLFRVIQKEHNGIKFTMYESEVPNRAEVATQEAKYHLDGRSSVTEALEQTKYGDEIIIQVYGKAGSMVKKQRVNSNYDRIQVFFKRDVFIEICQRFLKELEIRGEL